MSGQSCMEKIAKCPVPVNFPLPAKQPLRYRNKTAFRCIGEKTV